MRLGRSAEGALRGAGWVPGGWRAGQGGFSLAELMVVIAIIAILASIGIPALRGLGESNAIDAATRQVLDDLAYARLRAINDRTTVYMLFVPPQDRPDAGYPMPTNLYPRRFTGYTLYARRSIGEQPGRSSPRQLIGWRELPDKTFFPADMFFTSIRPALETARPLAWTPKSWWGSSATEGEVRLIVTNQPYGSLSFPYIAFNPQGQLVRLSDNTGSIESQGDEILTLAKGSIVHPQNASGQYDQAPDVVEIPKGNRRYIRVNWLTGRSEVIGDLIAGSGSTVQISRQPE